MKATELLSIKQLAELLGVSTDTIRRAARSGLIPSTREGTAYRFDWQRVHQAMDERGNKMSYRRNTDASARRAATAGRAQGLPAPGLVTRGLG